MIFDLFCHRLSENVGQAQTLLCGTHADLKIIHDERWLEVYEQILVAAQKTPSMQGPGRHEAIPDAAMIAKVGWRIWSRMAIQVRRGADNGCLMFAADSDSHHVVRKHFALANPRVASGGDNVDQAIVDDEFNLYVGMMFLQGGEPGQNEENGSSAMDVDLYRPCDAPLPVVQVPQPTAYLAERGLETGCQIRSGMRWRHAARSAQQQGCSKFRLKTTHSVAEPRWGDIQFRGCFSESAFLDDGKKGHQVGEVFTLH
ncbi:hypothetical protein PSCICN_20220 [Pseudomonas cichorii]|nr:hypothetical protein PSCICN_20220 [Pseudomonas cichorii]